jgi:hypothetical protein
MGWGASIEAEQVRNLGQQRLTGLLRFVEYFVRQRGVSEALFEACIARLTGTLQQQ